MQLASWLGFCGQSQQVTHHMICY